jgi:hypothetical protein
MSKTKAFILIAVAIIVVFDVFLIFSKGAPSSISAYIIRASEQHPSISFGFGFLAGHLFWRMPDQRVYKDKD